MAAWDIQSLQVVVWAAPGTPAVDPVATYTQVFGKAPNGVQQQVAAGVTSANGTVGTDTYVLQNGPGRVDLFQIPNRPSGPFIPIQDDPDAAFDRLLIFAEKIPIYQSARVAIVANTVSRTSDNEAAVRIVSEAIDDRLSLAGSTDLMFQVNRRGSLAHGLEVNRFIKWASVALKNISLDTGTPVMTDVFFASSVIDINTVSEPSSMITSTERTTAFTLIRGEIQRIMGDNRLEALN